jgi:hypothetical protein
MLKHHCSTLFFILPTPKTLQSTISSPFSSMKQLRPQFFRLFSSVAETPLPTTFHYFPMLKHHCSALFYSSHSQNTPVRHFLTIFIDETTSSNNCFAFSLLLLKHHYQQLFTIFPMLKHHCSTLLTFFRCRNTIVQHF